jgi:cytochrome c oxidase subunit 3
MSAAADVHAHGHEHGHADPHGGIMLEVILARCLKGHFKPDQHFAFEAVAWYWL